MTTLDDLAALPFFGTEGESFMLAVGWLGSDVELPAGSTSPAVYRRLRELLKDPPQPFGVVMGSHACKPCQFDGPSGTPNLFVPAGERLFVAPELVAHYISAHHYQPPEEFCDAVLACPDGQTMEYKRALLASDARDLMRARTK